MDDEGQEQPATLAEATTLANQAITDLNTLISDNTADPTGKQSLADLQTIKNDIVELENILTAFNQQSRGGQ